MSPHSTNNNGVADDLRYIPLSYNNVESQTSALLLIVALKPEWEHAEGKIEFVHFKDGITNTVQALLCCIEFRC